MIAPVFIVLFAALSEATVTVTIDSIKAEREEFEYVCPVTGYKVTGYSWSTCHDGESKTIGCVSGTGERYLFGQRFVDQIAEWECRSDGDTIILEPVACVVKGQVMQIGEIMQDGKFYRQCSKRGDGSIAIDVIGCSDSAGEMVLVNGTFVRGKFQFMCDESETEVFEKIISCIVDDMMIPVGTTIQTGDVIVECSRKGQRKAKIEIVGCADPEGKPLDDGETIVRGTVVYKCLERSEGQRFSLEAVGCYAKAFRMDQYTEYLFGESWYDSYGESIRMRLRCERQGRLVGPVVDGCQFVVDDASHDLEIGCGRHVGKYVLTCQLEAGTSLKARKKRLGKEDTVEMIMKIAQVQAC